MGFEPTFSCLRSRAPRPLEDRRVGAVHRSRTDTLWVEVRDAAVEHQHRFVWGGAGNRTLALTSTASRAATDTSATVVLVWALGFEPRTSSVRGRCSGQAELHPVGRRSRTRTGIIRSSGEGPTAWTNRQCLRISFPPLGFPCVFPAGRARPGPGRFKLPPGSTPDLQARAIRLARALYGSPARLRTWNGRINSPAPVPTGTPRNEKAPLFRAGLHEDSYDLSCYPMESPHPILSSLDRTSRRDSWHASAAGKRLPAGRCVMRYVTLCFITGPRLFGPLI